MITQQRTQAYVTCAIMAILCIFGAQNCGQKVSFDSGADQSQSSSSIGGTPLATDKALVYGDSTQDQGFLAAKIAGYAAPTLADTISNWRRLSGPTIYNSVSDINIPTETNAYCATTISAVTGDWANVKNPAGTTIAPGTSGDCINLPWFDAISWIYLSNGHLHHATNSGNFNGFISSLKFDHFVYQATVTSTSKDDDEIALIIAAVVDSNGVLNTLSASRNNGGTVSSKYNWQIVYRQGNTVIKTFGAKAVDSVNTNGSTQGDGNGWNGRKSLIHVERDGDSIQATTSNWSLTDAALTLNPTSTISIDLSDASLGLSVFQGEQYYGYGVLSEEESEFYNMSFAALTSDDYIYDLSKDLVYKQQANGTYAVQAGVSAFSVLGAPIIEGNAETQESYQLNADKTFSRVSN